MLRVNIRETKVCNTCYLMYLASSFMWLHMYESLHTYVVQLDLIWESYLILIASDILLRKLVWYLCSTWRRRSWILAPSLIWVAVRSGNDRQVRHHLLQRLALARCATLAKIMIPPIPWLMTIIYDVNVEMIPHHCRRGGRTFQTASHIYVIHI